MKEAIFDYAVIVILVAMMLAMFGSCVMLLINWNIEWFTITAVTTAIGTVFCVLTSDKQPDEDEEP